MKIRYFLAAVCLVMTAVSVSFADGFIIIEPPELRPGRVPPAHHVFAPLSVRYHKVDIDIKGRVAVTHVDQVFHNPNRRRMEGTFLFPVPKGARIDSFSMDINGKTMEAELLDADKARRIYEDIVRRMKDPALLEYVGQDTFKVAIYPIEPRSDKRIQLQYTQILEQDGDMTAYVYPLNTEKFSSAPIETVSVKASVSAGNYLASVYSPSHTVELVRKDDTRAVVGFEASNVRPDRDFILYFSEESQKDRELALDLLAYNDNFDEYGYFLLMASPVFRTGDSTPIEKDIVFVVDTSGSMLGDKLEQTKRALKYCITNLNPGDRFNVVRFSTEAEVLFDGPAGADDGGIREALQWVDGFKPRGGTAIHEALLKALDMRKTERKAPYRPARPQYIIFMTDGRPTIGIIDEDKITTDLSKAMSRRSARIFCFGVGTDINTHLLDRIAEQTGGVSRYVLPEEDIEVRLSSFYERIANPVLTNVDIKVSRNVRVSAMYPSSLPDLFKGDNLLILGRYKGHGDAAVEIRGDYKGRPLKVVDEIRFPAPGEAVENDFAPRLWATRRVGYLLDQIRINGETRELRAEVIRLAKQYNIVTPYTSYLILEDEARWNRPGLPQPVQGRSEIIRRELKKDFDGLKKEKSGFTGVGSAKSMAELKEAESADDAVFAADRAANLGKSDSGGPARKHRKSKYVKGRTFYLRGEVWIDSRITEKDDIKPVQIELGSNDYFKLMEQHENAHAWLAVGARVIIKMKNKIYEIK